MSIRRIQIKYPGLFFRPGCHRGDFLLFHILCMTSVMYRNGVAINRKCIIPIASLSHIPFLPSFNPRFPPQGGLLNAVDCINCLVDISQHIIVRINVRVSQAYIPVERSHLSDGKRLDNIVILHPSLRRLN